MLEISGTNHGPSFRQAINESLSSLWGLRRRSLLALLGIVVGCASVVALLNIGKNASNEAIKAFQGLGTNTIVVGLSARPNMSRRAPAVMEMAPLKMALPAVKYISPLISMPTKIRYNGHETDGIVLGGGDDLLAVLDLHLSKGRSLTSFDSKSTFAVAGAGIATELGLQIGSEVQMGSYLFQIIGILSSHPQNPILSVAPDTTLLVPIESIRRLAAAPEIASFAAQAQDSASVVLAAESLTNYLSERLPGHIVNAQVPQQLLDGLKKQSETFAYLLAALGGISLLVAGVGIMNIMLTNVAERKKEIGIRAALGGRPRDIRNLFLIEALLLSMIGAIAGAIIGVGVSWVFAKFSGWEFKLSIYAIPLGILSSLLIGLVFGIHPALSAANLQPVQALRDE